MKLRTTTSLNGKVFDLSEGEAEQPFVQVKSTEEIVSLANHQHKPFGYCIYCGSTTELSREHVIPLALNGELVLPKASCNKCADITQSFETPVLKGMFADVRYLLNLRSRSKHADARKVAPITVVRGGEKETLQLPIEDYPILMFVPTFSPPRYFTGESGVGISINGRHAISYGPRPDEVLKKLGATEITLESSNIFPVAFARMLAKIAFGFAVSEGKLHLVRSTKEIVDSILGNANDIGRWVGTITDPPQCYPNLLHRISIHEEANTGVLAVQIQLFSDAAAPTYGVILGELR